MKTSLQIGITSLLPKDKFSQVLLFENDNENFILGDFLFSLEQYMNDYRISYRDMHLTIYKSDKGFHMISLNEYPLYQLFKLAFEMSFDKYTCKKQYGYAIRQDSFTLRITEKTLINPKTIPTYEKGTESFDMCESNFKPFLEKHKPKEIIYHQWGYLPISKPHYEIFKMLFNNPEFNLEENDTLLILRILEKVYELKSHK